jgi:hypothetical protein
MANHRIICKFFNLLDESLLNPIIRLPQDILFDIASASYFPRNELISSILNQDLEIPEAVYLDLDLELSVFTEGSRISRTEMKQYAQMYYFLLSKTSPFAIRPNISYSADSQFTIIALETICGNTDIPSITGVTIPLPNGQSPYSERSVLTFDNKDEIIAGPISHISHDCKPNARIYLRPLGKLKQIHIRTLQEIKAGEEITIFYGRDYFGKGNEDCLCRSCEMSIMNRFSAETLPSLLGAQHIGRLKREGTHTKYSAKNSANGWR